MKKVTRDNIIVDLGNNAEVCFPGELVGRETFRINDRVRAILTEINTESRGPSDSIPRVPRNAGGALQDRGARDLRGCDSDSGGGERSRFPAKIAVKTAINASTLSELCRYARSGSGRQ